MSSKAQVLLLSALLIALGLGLTAYKALQLGFPLLPGEYRTVWTIEAKVSFQADGNPVRASLALPRVQPHMRILDETFSSAGYGFQVDESDGQYRAIWSRREAAGQQHLFYKLSVYRRDDVGLERLPAPQPVIIKPVMGSTQQDAVRLAAQSVIFRARELSADRETFTRQILSQLLDADNRDAGILRGYYSEAGLAQIAVDLLALAEIPAHVVRGIYLQDDRRRQLTAQELLEVFVDQRWMMFNPTTGRSGLPPDFFMWQRGGRSLLDVEGGRNSEVTFSLIANDISARTVALQQGGREATALLDFSIYSLPIEQQSVFKLILLVPVGAMVVILFRVFIGIRTAGTFMPVLLALAFIQTQLLTGLSIFLLILAVGLGMRSYLSRLNLLLVARIAAVVVIVVVIMAAISVFSYKLRIDQALTVVFFPMIILAWTIERMSILWEEDGPREVFIQVSGSLLVAISAYGLMTNRQVEHLSFNFPELMLVALGIILLLGQYSGYRLSEIIRFRHLRDDVP